MDGTRFDTLTRALTDAHSRRRALAALIGGTLGLLGLADMEAKNTTRKHPHSEGKGKKKGNGKKKKKKKGGNQTPASPPAPPPPPPPVCTPSCTGGRTCQNGTCACPSGTQFCQIPQTCQQCCINVDCCGELVCPADRLSCQGGTCACQGGREFCGGACLTPCAAGEERTATCGCCKSEGTSCAPPEGTNATCCSGFCSIAIGCV